MEAPHRIILKQNREAIVEDLDVEYILDYLCQESVINDENRQLILSHKTRQARARNLLDILPCKGSKAFGIFVKSLKTDYDWIADKLETDSGSFQDSPASEEHAKTILMRGGVPKHHNFVLRTEMRYTRNALKELTKERYVVLHGMPGSGKSVIASESLWDNQLIMEYFQDGVFWVKVGDVQPDQLLAKFRALCIKLNAATMPNDIEQGQEILRKLLSSENYSNCLLVLDDVWKSEVVRAFKLPIKTMITTQDSSIMDVINKTCITMIDCNTGFTEEQSLNFFSNNLRVDEKDLPSEAALIHQEARGNPMIISLVASLIAQSENGTERWNYYVHSLRNRSYGKITKQSSYEHDGIMDAVKMSIQALDDDLRKKYEQLAVFLDDDPIPTAALQKLWDLDKYDVEDMMNTFVRKSLASSEWDSIQESTLYSFHDLHLAYLRSQDTLDALAHKHKTFVHKYLQTVQNDRFEDLENDNYIFSHLAYHLDKAGMREYFPRIFLNLLYMERVIKECGTAALLHAYKRYGDSIINGDGREDLHKDEFDDFEEFCRTKGVMLCANESGDIVQLGLAEHPNSQVYIQAKQLVNSETNAYYLEWKNREGVNSRTVATVMHTDREAMDISFLPDNRIATVTGDGVVKVWDWISGEILQRLRGHEGHINCLSGSVGGEYICTGGSDGTIKFWSPDPVPEHNMDKDLPYRRRSVYVKKKNSPKTSQPESWNQVLGAQKDDSKHSIKVDVCPSGDGNEVLSLHWRPFTNQVAVSTRSGVVIVYENLREKFRITRHTEPVYGLQYDASGKMLAVCCDDCTVTVWDAESGDYKSDIRYHKQRVLGLAWLGHLHKLASISMEELIVWENPGRGAEVNALTRNRVASWNCVAANDEIIAAGTTSENLVVLWCVQSRQVVAALPGHNNHIVSLFLTTVEEDYEDGTVESLPMLASLSDQMFIIWNLKDVSNTMEQELLSLGPLHHTRWQGQKAVTAAPDDRNRVTLLKAGERIHKSVEEREEITAIILSKDCNSVIYGTSGGHIKKYRKGTTPEVLTMSDKHDMSVLALEVTQEGVIISGGVDSEVKIFHSDGTVFKCSGHNHFVRDLILISSESQVLSCDSKGILKMWDIATGKEVSQILEGFTSHSSCIDVWESQNSMESYAAVGGVTGGITILDLKTGQVVRKIAEDGLEIRKARFGPSGSYLATGHDSGDIQVWDVKTGHALLATPLKLHESWVKDIVISKDGKKMLTVGDRLIWWSLEFLAQAQTQAVVPRRKLSLPPRIRSRKSSESKSNCSSIHEDSLTESQLAAIPHSATSPALSTQLPTSATSPPPPLRSALTTNRTQPINMTSSSSPLINMSPGSPLINNTVLNCQLSPPLRSPTMRRTERALSGSPQQRPLSLNLSSPSPLSPAQSRKNRKAGRGKQKELLQTFDMKGNSADKVFVNEDFTKFVTVDDAGILYILEEYKPQKPQIFLFDSKP